MNEVDEKFSIRVMLGYDDDEDDGQGLYAWRFRDTCVCSNVSLCVACSNVHAREGDLILKRSLLQDFGRENELLYFIHILYSVAFPRREVWLLAASSPERQPAKKHNENRQTKEDKLQSAHGKDIGLSQKCAQQRHGGPARKNSNATTSMSVSCDCPESSSLLLEHR